MSHLTCFFSFIKQTAEKMKRLILIAFALTTLKTFGQDATVKDIQAEAAKVVTDDTAHKEGWKRGALVNIGLAQGSTSNWAAGGDKFSLALNGFVNLFANLKHGKTKWYNSLDLYYGVMKSTTQGMRKNDDRIDFFSKYTYSLKPKLGFGFVGSFRTQFTNGYDYGKTPEELTSGFMSPGYLTLAPGFDWTPCEPFSLFFTPAAGRWTFVSNSVLAPKYGLDPGKSVRTEFGAYVSANYKKEILKNVTYKARMDLYSNYLHNPQNVDIYWTNLISLKVNKFLAVTYSLDLIYDDDVKQFGPNGTSAGTQIKSMLNVGITKSF
jgi:hypothetical protein